MYRHEESSTVPRRKALLVGIALQGQAGWAVDEHLDELAELARTAGVEIVGRVVQGRRSPDPATFVGRGKAEEIGTTANALGADLLVFDDDLSPSQVKNLEKIAERQVMDRSALILEIFNLRARSREARTQVELARLTYLLPRLTRRWRHLSRQAGGQGQRGGEGETQLEADRRILRRQIQKLKVDLVRIERTREVQRHGRRGAEEVAIAGYTNAGKSTLFNRLTDAGTLAEDKLFATLDSKLRRGSLGGRRTAVFADTVGFIRKLPHHLVSSFRSTLGEITAADLVLHVVDRSHPAWQEQAEVAAEVLAGLDVAPGRILTVYNKIDLLQGHFPAGARADGVAWVSAANGAGLADLKGEIASRLDRLAEHGPAPLPEPPRPPARERTVAEDFEDLLAWSDPVGPRSVDPTRPAPFRHPSGVDRRGPAH